MTSNRKNTNRAAGSDRVTTWLSFERLASGALAGLVAFGVVVAVAYPNTGVTQAPRAAFDLQAILMLEPVPRIPVVKAALDAPGIRDGLTVDELSETLRYDLDSIAEGDAAVPRIFIKELPEDLDEVPEVQTKKAVFFKSVLPLVLQVNEEILNNRERLLALRDARRSGKTLSAADREWLASMAARYKTDADNLDILIRRVDIIPPSLALAQAAKESGWGTSRFARQGNALFGQWAWDDDAGIAPEDRPEGMTHVVRQFETPMESVRAYMLNLNTHRAYRKLRSIRAGMRARDESVSGVALARGLERYSELGMEYVERIQGMISYNELSQLDNAELSSQPSI